ncbi:MAG: metal ABC transporter permease [Proteobacteria bacterium]|nr:metal ABC transporter permease [Pseudomonadota bacterium]
MFESFLIQSFVALIFTVISCSLLGVFVVWQKISYFGDALSHAVLLGLAIGVLLEINPILALIIFSTLFAILIFLATKNRNLGKDAAVMICSYFCIALAIILNDLWIQNLDFSSYIFGDILAVETSEIVALSLIALTTIFYTIFGVKKILLINLNSDLAQISGIKIKFWELSFLILLAVTVALATRVVGIFLTTALLVLPAAIARIFSTSATQMLITSALIGVVVACFSFQISSEFDLTVGPVMIEIFCVIFFTTKLAQLLRR